MFVELHLLQNFAPSNLNRDDTGAPKDCEFGGVRRARISSQALKRAMRDLFRRDGLVPPDNLAFRTRLLVDEVAKRLVARGQPEAEARRVAGVALGSVQLSVDQDSGRTGYLLFLGASEIERLATLCQDHWDDLAGAAASEVASGEPSATPARGRARRAAAPAVPAEVSRGAMALLDGGKAADIALFGRMVADLPDKNIDAACQVAHAISTHRVSMEFDFYTAVDDLQQEDTSGAGMMGTIEFNSACFYRYANVDLDQLVRNLDGDEALARKTLEGFLRASIAAIPTGKQNSMAAQNPPSFILAVARRGGLWSLANAFARPVHPSRDGNLVQTSITALDSYWGKLVQMYGDHDIVGAWACTLESDGVTALKDNLVQSVDLLVEKAVPAATAGNEGRE